MTSEIAKKSPKHPSAPMSISRAVAAVLCVAGTADAATSVWTNQIGGTQQWSTTSNWVNPPTPGGDPTSVIQFFNDATTSFSASGTVTANNDLAGTYVLNTLTLNGKAFGSTASGANVVNITGNPLQFDGTNPFINLNANRYNGSYTLTYNINSTLTLAQSATLAGSGSATFNFGGAIGGTGGLTKTGTAAANFTAANGYTGATSVNGGTMTVSGVSGAIAGSSAVTVAGGVLTLDNTAGTANRIGNAAPVSLATGGNFAVIGNSTGTTETVGTLGLSAGQSYLSLTQGTVNQATVLAASGFSRSGSAVAVFRGANLGLSATASASANRITLTDASGVATVGTVTSTTGATTSNATVKIVPYLVGGTSATDVGSTFVTYDTVSGFRNLINGGTGSEIGSLASGSSNPINVIGSPQNVRNVSSGAINYIGTTGVPNQTFNSVFVAGGATANGFTATTPGSTLTITSGAILASIVFGATTTNIDNTFAKVTLGNGTWNEGVITTTANGTIATLNIASALDVTGGGGLTKAGGGVLGLSHANLYTGTTNVLAGTLNGAADGVFQGNVSVAAAALLSVGGGTTNNYIADAATLTLASGAVDNLNYVGTDTVAALILNGVSQPAGVYGASTNSAFFTGTGTITVVVPEPAGLAVAGIAGVVTLRRRRVVR